MKCRIVRPCGQILMGLYKKMLYTVQDISSSTLMHVIVFWLCSDRVRWINWEWAMWAAWCTAALTPASPNPTWSRWRPGGTRGRGSEQSWSLRWLRSTPTLWGCCWSEVGWTGPGKWHTPAHDARPSHVFNFFFFFVCLFFSQLLAVETGCIMF